jgi:carotenoid cleavage dioxygenase-like enzyme
MTAHPKTCPTTGEMLFFGYSPMPPFITYHVVDADGKLVRSEPINAPYPSMIHDFLVSENHVIFPVFPAVFDLAAMGQGKPGITWKPELGVHIGVMPRDGSDGDVTWIPMDPVHAFHFMNAYEDGDEIVADASCYAQLPLFEGDFDVDAPALPPDFRRWRFDVAARSVKEETIDDGVMEFPRIDERWNGRRHRHGFTAGAVAERLNQGYDRLHHYDLETGSCQAHVLPDGDKTSEAVFVPRGDGADEGEGYVLALAYRGAEHRSDLLVLDARNLDAEPVASVKLPHRIPGGFHGNWMPGGDAWRP